MPVMQPLSLSHLTSFLFSLSVFLDPFCCHLWTKSNQNAWKWDGNYIRVSICGQTLELLNQLCRGCQWGAQHVCICTGMGAFPRVIVAAVLAAGFMAGLVGVDIGITEQTDLEAE